MLFYNDKVIFIGNYLDIKGVLTVIDINSRTIDSAFINDQSISY